MKTMLPLLPPGPGGFTKSPLPGPNHKRVTRRSLELMNGGESGIRTHGRSPYTRVPGEHNRPLCHLSTRLIITGFLDASAPPGGDADAGGGGGIRTPGRLPYT